VLLTIGDTEEEKTGVKKTQQRNNHNIGAVVNIHPDLAILPVSESRIPSIQASWTKWLRLPMN